MPGTSESIDQLIEESYLLGLTEDEIRADLDRFVEVCGRVIRDHVSDRRQMQDLAQKLARARALSLIEDQRDEEVLPEAPIAEDELSRERFAEKVARSKCLILRTIRDCNPKLLELIERERYPALGKQNDPAVAFSGGQARTAKSLVFKVFYAVTLVFVLLLIYLVLLQQNF